MTQGGLVYFRFEGKSVPVYPDVAGNPWWRASEICEAVGVKNHRDAISRLDDDEKGVVSTDTLGGPQGVVAVNEAGLYSLTLSSRKPEAKRFKRWVTHEVLPALRRTGTYSTRTAPAKTARPAFFSMRTTAERVERLALASRRTGLKKTTIVERALDDWMIKIQVEDAERERLIAASKQYLLSRPIP